MRRSGLSNSRAARSNAPASRALSARPDILLFDERLSSLGANLRDQLGRENRAFAFQARDLLFKLHLFKNAACVARGEFVERVELLIG